MQASYLELSEMPKNKQGSQRGGLPLNGKRLLGLPDGKVRSMTVLGWTGQTGQRQGLSVHRHLAHSS